MPLLELPTPRPDLELGEFVRFILLLLHRKKTDLSLVNKNCWHRLVHRLSAGPTVPGKPPMLRFLEFGWYGPSADLLMPECESLGTTLSNLCRFGFVEWSTSKKPPQYVLPMARAAEWSTKYNALSDNQKRYFEGVVLPMVEWEWAKH